MMDTKRLRSLAEESVFLSVESSELRAVLDRLDLLEQRCNLLISTLRDFEEKTFKAWLLSDGLLDLVRDRIAQWENEK